MKKTKEFLFLLILVLCWGPSYLFIKISLEELGPMTVAAARLTIGAIFLFSILLFRRKNLWNYRKHWKHFLFMGIFLNAFPFSMINYGETSVTSGLTAILISLTPIFTALIARIVATEEFSLRKIMGTTVSFLGIVFIYFPTFFADHIGSTQGIIAISLASLSYAVSTVYARKYLQDLPLMIAPTAQLSIASVIMVILALVFENPHIPSPGVSGAVLTLGIWGTGFAFFIYYELLRKEGATFVSLNALLSPIIAVLLGWLVLGETLKWNAYVGGMIVLIGLAITNPLLSPRGLRKLFKNTPK